ncbi:hypothetical protein [Bradyrhizobium japonicum]|uniref:hypothetical protein n=1 Tax=Bradyrhizobium japonicum TaxID=375 RepID=UPI002714CB59|nr:hypothetical protein [Bradyrhizobium japonicum]WLB52796.1 hypothetical protein QIH94_36620 [Bradyrhizobium japonicum]
MIFRHGQDCGPLIDDCRELECDGIEQVGEKRIAYHPNLGKILEKARHLAVSKLVSALAVHPVHSICDAD